MGVFRPPKIGNIPAPPPGGVPGGTPRVLAAPPSPGGVGGEPPQNPPVFPHVPEENSPPEGSFRGPPGGPPRGPPPGGWGAGDPPGGAKNPKKGGFLTPPAPPEIPGISPPGGDFPPENPPPGAPRGTPPGTPPGPPPRGGSGRDPPGGAPPTPPGVGRSAKTEVRNRADDFDAGLTSYGEKITTRDRLEI